MIDKKLFTILLRRCSTLAANTNYTQECLKQYSLPIRIFAKETVLRYSLNVYYYRYPKKNKGHCKLEDFPYAH